MTHGEKEVSLIRIDIDETVKNKWKGNLGMELKGIRNMVTVRDFPVHDNGLDLLACQMAQMV